MKNQINEEYAGFRKGQSVTCILNNRASLTVGKEYTIEYIYVGVPSRGSGFEYSIEKFSQNSEYEFWISVVNDNGHTTEYHPSRFIDKSILRKYKLNQLID